ncbi:MAG: hypothetical protein KAY32_02375 [Candidatus Eisenbacteria sp.]|nr:hypothetical protein [Candidatus Eisenbacteria bacterium]
MALLLLAAAVCGTLPAHAADEFAALEEGALLAGFQAVARYEAEDARPIGARFVHLATGTPVDLLRFDTVPQAFVWVRTIPASDGGEPHAGEHLVLGKGTKGRHYALLTDMSIGNHSASTWRDKTIYHCHTAGGTAAFSELLYRMLDALVRADFSDEEIRRELCHHGVLEDQATGTLSLEEKGTVYVEMVSAYEKPGTIVWNEILRRCFGPGHPLGWESGGRPDAIREVTPAGIRRFFADCYDLGPALGLILALPGSFALQATLADVDRILTELSGTAGETGAHAAASEPGRRPDPLALLPPLPETLDAQITLHPFPSDNPATPGQAAFAWLPRAGLEAYDTIALEALWHLLAGDEASYLYRDLVDQSQRIGPAGITSVSGFLGSMVGQPPMLWLSGLDPAILDAASLADVRRIVTERLARIAALEPGTPEFAELRERAANYLIGERRVLLENIDAPPRFGFRGTGDFWYQHLQLLERAGGFHRDLLLQASHQRLEEALAQGNPWADLIPRLALADAPAVVAAFPDTAMPARLGAEKRDRLRRATAELTRRYGVDDEQEALRRYRAEFDATTETLREIEARVPQPDFLPDPPLTLDDLIDAQIVELPLAFTGTTPLCVTRFHHTAQIDFGLYFDVTATPGDDLIVLALLPALITDIGAWDGADWLPYDQVAERLRRDTGGVEATYAALPRESGCRVELALYGGGLTPDEARAAVAWTRRLLKSATRIEPSVLPRLRDVVAREIASLRQTMMGSEEDWAWNPPHAYRHQHEGAYLSALAIFTRLHHLNRLAWMLTDPPAPEELDALRAKLERVGSRHGATREDLATYLTGLIEAQGAEPEPGSLGTSATPDPTPSTLRMTCEYLLAELGTLPDETFRDDCDRLAGQVLTDLPIAPAVVLARLSACVERLWAAGPARAHLTAARETAEEIQPELARLIRGFGTHWEPHHPPAAPITGHITRNLSGRYPEARARHSPVALVHESSRNGLFANSAPLITYAHADREALLDYLTARVIGGQGGHSLFMQTWAAGLAYSNGVGCSPRRGYLTYYAERCTDAAATLAFVIDKLAQADETLTDPALLDYALANTFSDYRGADTYVARGRAIAADLTDGITPDRVRRFKEALMELRAAWQDPEEARTLLADLRRRLPALAGRVVPGYGQAPAEPQGAITFLIGPETQITKVEALLAQRGRPQRFLRLRPRDYWIDAGGD